MKELIDEIKLSIESEDFAQRRTGRKGNSYYNGLAAGYREGYRNGFAEAGGKFLKTSQTKENQQSDEQLLLKHDVKASAFEKLEIAKKALNDIYNFDRDMEFEYGDPGERAMRALEKIDRIDGF